MEKLFTDEIKALGQLFNDSGYELRIVGGAVRDVLLGKEPKDIDFCTDATPDEMIAMVTDAGMHYIPTGLQHGTISVVGTELFEITTLRIDTDTDGRHATVEFTTDFELDAARRDFTFNAMSVDMKGNLYDYFNGRYDLEHNKVVFVGTAQERIEEDYLRILRYFRFMGRMDKFVIPPRDVLNALRHGAIGLRNISAERVWSEVQKIVNGKHTYTIFWLMTYLGIADVVNTPRPNPMQHTKVSELKTNNHITKLAFLTQGVDLHPEWKMSTKETKLLEFLLVTQQPSLHTAKVMLTDGVALNDLVELLVMSGNDKMIHTLRSWSVPVFPVTGKDLKAAGVTPGPDMGVTLNAMKQVWQASNFTDSKKDLMNAF